MPMVSGLNICIQSLQSQNKDKTQKKTKHSQTKSFPIQTQKQKMRRVLVQSSGPIFKKKRVKF